MAHDIVPTEVSDAIGRIPSTAELFSGLNALMSEIRAAGEEASVIQWAFDASAFHDRACLGLGEAASPIKQVTDLLREVASHYPDVLEKVFGATIEIRPDEQNHALLHIAFRAGMAEHHTSFARYCQHNGLALQLPGLYEHDHGYGRACRPAPVAPMTIATHFECVAPNQDCVLKHLPSLADRASNLAEKLIIEGLDANTHHGDNDALDAAVADLANDLETLLPRWIDAAALMNGPQARQIHPRSVIDARMATILDTHLPTIRTAAKQTKANDPQATALSTFRLAHSQPTATGDLAPNNRGRPLALVVSNDT